MKNKKSPLIGATNTFEQGLTKPREEKHVLRLYIAGKSSRSMLAISNLKKICKDYLKNNYELEIIDLFQFPDLAQVEQIIAAPTLIKESPFPLKRIIGDMSNTDKVLLGLNLK
ncbi:circadian clock KaiB family protein [Paucihalobacter sp.]|uniref:circadian clock KaiB family protein n=1 Tax=Paucihalobacter sp. TaxID=2850405 RepID=UPI002FE0CC12